MLKVAVNVSLSLTVNGVAVTSNNDWLVAFVEVNGITPTIYPLDNAGGSCSVSFSNSVSTAHYFIIASNTEFQIENYNLGNWIDNGSFSDMDSYDTNISGSTAIPTTYGHKTPFSEYATENSSYVWEYALENVSYYIADGDFNVSVELSTVSSAKNITYTHQDGDDYFNVSPSSPIVLGTGNNLELEITPSSGYRFASGTQEISVGGGNYTVIIESTTGVGSVTVLNEDLSDGDVITFNITMEEIPVPRRNFFTVYAPTPGNMQTINDAIFLSAGGASEDVSHYFSSYRKFWCRLTLSGNSRELMAGRYDFGEQSPTIDEYIQIIDCGGIKIEELAESLVDYNPYSRIVVYLPFIGFENLSTREFMGHILRVQYKVDVLSGRCLCELYTDIISPETCVAQFSGTIASDEIFGSNNGMGYYGMYELMTTNQLGGLTPYVLVYTKVVHDADTSDYEGLPTEEEKIVGECSGFVKFDSVKVDGIIAKKVEIDAIEKLLLTGIYI